MTEVLTSVLTVAALAVMTLGVVGLARFESLLLRLHAAAKIGAVGVVLLAIAAAVAGVGVRALLIAGFVIVTAPVASHVLAAASAEAHRKGTDA